MGLAAKVGGGSILYRVAPTRAHGPDGWWPCWGSQTGGGGAVARASQRACGLAGAHLHMPGWSTDAMATRPSDPSLARQG